MLCVSVCCVSVCCVCVFVCVCGRVCVFVCAWQVGELATVAVLASVEAERTAQVAQSLGSVHWTIPPDALLGASDDDVLTDEEKSLLALLSTTNDVRDAQRRASAVVERTASGEFASTLAAMRHQNEELGGPRLRLQFVRAKAAAMLCTIMDLDNSIAVLKMVTMRVAGERASALCLQPQTRCPTPACRSQLPRATARLFAEG